MLLYIRTYMYMGMHSCICTTHTTVRTGLPGEGVMEGTGVFSMEVIGSSISTQKWIHTK